MNPFFGWPIVMFGLVVVLPSLALFLLMPITAIAVGVVSMSKTAPVRRKAPDSMVRRWVRERERREESAPPPPPNFEQGE